MFIKTVIRRGALLVVVAAFLRHSILLAVLGLGLYAVMVVSKTAD
jgi:hypothetical protein